MKSLRALIVFVLLAIAAPSYAEDIKGPAPDFTGIDHWLNSDPLTIESLRGKVVLVDFWTYSCINCIRTLPYVTKWYDTYKDKGLVVVGVHTPEFPFEKETANVETAIKRFNIHYPVAQDNEYGTFNAYKNHYWPAEYLIDRQGNIIRTHFGEGEYDEMEKAIQKALDVSMPVGADAGSDLSAIGSPEMYFGLKREEYQASDQAPKPGPNTFVAKGEPALNHYALDGQWTLDQEKAVSISPNAGITLKFRAPKLNMVASADQPVTLSIIVDGKAQPPVTVQAAQLYTLYSGEAGTHLVTIKAAQPGLKAFTFTFG
jgi:thiol-disulfide isomerase/thioredoxin